MSAETPPSSGEVFVPGELDWIEKAAIENLKGRVATADILAKEAVATLTVLLAGAGGGWALGLKLFDDQASTSAVAAFIAGAWLTLLSMALVWFCMKIDAIPAVYNQPRQLLGRAAQGATFDEWRRHELDNIEERIRDAVKRNNKVASSLNWIRVLATLTPILSGVSAWIYRIT
jgi:hypothetical protein